MNKALSNTIEFVTGKQNLNQISQKEVQDIIASYPYFAPAQLVYAAKLRADNSYQVQTQVQKAGLYFNNARWLQYQLIDVSVESFKTIENETTTINISSPELEVIEEKIQIEQNEIIINDNTTEDNVAVNKIDFMSNLNIPTVEDVKNIMSGIDENNEQKNELENIDLPLDTKDLQELNTSITSVEENIGLLQNNNTEEALKPHFEMSLDVNENIYNEIAKSNTVEVEENDIHSQIAALKANWHKNKIEDSLQEIITTHNKQEIAETNKENEEIAEEIIPEKIIEAKIAIPSLRSDWDKPKEHFANELLPFETEPYYTIDYFASQGIKFDFTKEPHDKLTTKMLKFTDWLKKMRNVTPENIVVEEDPELDKAILNIATASNQSKEIVTETMAEIFAKQGKKEKAVQLYIKLSFLLPEKTAYFANKIKELKGI